MARQYQKKQHLLKQINEMLALGDALFSAAFHRQFPQTACGEQRAKVYTPHAVK